MGPLQIVCIRQWLNLETLLVFVANSLIQTVYHLKCVYFHIRYLIGIDFCLVDFIVVLPWQVVFIFVLLVASLIPSCTKRQHILKLLT